MDSYSILNQRSTQHTRNIVNFVIVAIGISFLYCIALQSMRLAFTNIVLKDVTVVFCIPTNVTIAARYMRKGWMSSMTVFAMGKTHTTDGIAHTILLKGISEMINVTNKRKE